MVFGKGKQKEPWNKGKKGLLNNGGFKKGRISENKGKTVALGFTNLKKNCELCGKEYTPRIRVASRQKFCSSICTDMFHKGCLPQDILKHDYSKRNIHAPQEHQFVKVHKKEIAKLIGEKCALCSSKGDVHHLTYLNLPHDNLKEYSKALMPLCPKHHFSFHQVMNKYGGIE